MAKTTLKMTSEEARTYLREQIEDYLNNDMGINTKGNFTCVAGTHDDNNPSMSLDRKNLQAHCFQCGAKFDIFDLVGINENITDFRDQLEFLCDLYYIDIVRTDNTTRSRTTAKKVTNPIALAKRRMQYRLDQLAGHRMFSGVSDSPLPSEYYDVLDDRGNNSFMDVVEGWDEKMNAFTPHKEEGPVKKLKRF